MEIGKQPTLIKDISRLHPKMQEATKEFLKRCEKAGVKIFITQTLRTVETQQEYYSWGRTKINPNTKKMTKVTKCDGINIKSRHQSGLAIDIACKPPSKPYDENILRKAGEIAEEIGLTWGGRWKEFRDIPHIEMNPKIVANFKIKDNGGNEMVVKEKMIIDGEPTFVNVIKKDNQNFVKLADLRKVIDIYFRQSTKQVEINKKK